MAHDLPNITLEQCSDYLGGELDEAAEHAFEDALFSDPNAGEITAFVAAFHATAEVLLKVYGSLKPVIGQEQLDALEARWKTQHFEPQKSSSWPFPKKEMAEVVVFRFPPFVERPTQIDMEWWQDGVCFHTVRDVAPTQPESPVHLVCARSDLELMGVEGTRMDVRFVDPNQEGNARLLSEYSLAFEH